MGEVSPNYAAHADQDEEMDYGDDDYNPEDQNGSPHGSQHGSEDNEGAHM